MTQDERRIYLIKSMLSEQKQYENTEIPSDKDGQKTLLRSLFNVRMPLKASDEFLKTQDDYLKEETRLKGITHVKDLIPVKNDLYIWQGDITTLDADAIVNAANCKLLGCFMPCHKCIDNEIHTYSGVQLRKKCSDIMAKRSGDEKTGGAVITPAYNLPCKYVIHTVGPIITGEVTENDEKLLASCYRSCLKAADEYKLSSIAFCCISTGVFRFPNERAAQIAINAVTEYKSKTKSEIKVIFNVFKSIDFSIYNKLLKKD